MTIEFAQAVYVDDGESVTWSELVERSGLSEAELFDLLDSGALSDAPSNPVSARFSVKCVVVAHSARRLRDQFALEDSHSLAVVVRLTQRIATLEAELRSRR
jgi:chaperone modulatory protein CbpM